MTSLKLTRFLISNSSFWYWGTNSKELAATQNDAAGVTDWTETYGNRRGATETVGEGGALRARAPFCVSYFG